MTNKLSIVQNYGPVVILRGKHKGKIGYYDDDEGEKAVVYLDTPFASDYILLSYTSIRITKRTHNPTYKWAKENPNIAYLMDVRSERM